MLSRIGRAELTSPPLPGVVVRYVACGTETYLIGNRWHRLAAGDLMISGQADGAFVEIGDRSGAETAGLCIYLPDRCLVEQFISTETPLTIPVGRSAVGELARSSMNRLISSRNREGEAAIIAARMKAALPALASKLGKELSTLPCVRTSTGAHVLRKVKLAQEYLHSVVDRPVTLQELASATGVSQFHLLRMFTASIGKTPAAYHREVRLRLVMQTSREKKLPLGMVADRFGFAGISSFSHAYRRAFGCAPSRS